MGTNDDDDDDAVDPVSSSDGGGSDGSSDIAEFVHFEVQNLTSLPQSHVRFTTMCRTLLPCTLVG